jgi:hypothetical protein
MHRVVIALVLAGLTGIPLAAQRTPDFSGTYVMQPTARQGGGMGGGGGATASASAGARAGGGAGGGGAMMGATTPPEITVSQTATSLTIERRSGGNTQTTIYKLDGSESVNSTGNVTTRSRSRWEGATLVTEGTQTIKTSQGEVSGSFKEMRSFDGSGQLVVDITRQTSSGQPLTAQQVYKKK